MTPSCRIGIADALHHGWPSVRLLQQCACWRGDVAGGYVKSYANWLISPRNMAESRHDKHDPAVDKVKKAALPAAVYQRPSCYLPLLREIRRRLHGCHAGDESVAGASRARASRSSFSSKSSKGALSSVSAPCILPSARRHHPK